MFVVNAQQEGGRFNSQPPEGGWVLKIRKELRDGWFQLTAARRRLGKAAVKQEAGLNVSTHSRPKAAG